jgi:hypothetical protein
MWHAWKKNRYSYNILVGKPKTKTSRGRHRPTREDNIKIDLMEIAGRCMG